MCCCHKSAIPATASNLVQNYWVNPTKGATTAEGIRKHSDNGPFPNKLHQVASSAREFLKEKSLHSSLEVFDKLQYNQ